MEDMTDRFTDQLAESDADLLNVSWTRGWNKSLALQQRRQVLQHTLQHAPVRLLQCEEYTKHTFTWILNSVLLAPTVRQCRRLSWQPSPTNRAFPVVGPRTWNDLPDDVTSAESMPTFHQQLKKSPVHKIGNPFSDYFLHWPASSGPSSSLYYCLGHSKNLGLIDWLTKLSTQCQLIYQGQNLQKFAKQTYENQEKIRHTKILRQKRDWQKNRKNLWIIYG